MLPKTLIVIAGPTAVGKTSMAIALASQWKTEIVSADSRQIFKEMEIGTAKPTAEELKAVPHHFINTQSVSAPYDAGTYSRQALAVIETLFLTHDKVILCGGSGLYINAVCDGFDDMPAVAQGVREEIMKEYAEKGIAWLQQQVADIDPLYFEKVDRQNPQRLVRALELAESTGRTMTELRKRKKTSHGFSILKAGLHLDREILYERIDHRVDAMIAAGLEEEARKLLPLKDLNALQTVGYAEFFGYFEGRYDREEAVRLLKRNTRHYAKRQMTWFNRDPDIKWFRPDQQGLIIEWCESYPAKEQASFLHP